MTAAAALSAGMGGMAGMSVAVAVMAGLGAMAAHSVAVAESALPPAFASIQETVLLAEGTHVVRTPGAWVVAGSPHGMMAEVAAVAAVGGTSRRWHGAVSAAAGAAAGRATGTVVAAVREIGAVAVVGACRCRIRGTARGRARGGAAASVGAGNGATAGLRRMVRSRSAWQHCWGSPAAVAGRARLRQRRHLKVVEAPRLHRRGQPELPPRVCGRTRRRRSRHRRGEETGPRRRRRRTRWRQVRPSRALGPRRRPRRRPEQLLGLPVPTRHRRAPCHGPLARRPCCPRQHGGGHRPQRRRRR